MIMSHENQELTSLQKGQKTNKLIAKHIHPRGFVLNCTGQNSYLYRPNLVRSPRFRQESMFNTQLIMLIWCFIPQFVFYTQSVVCSLQSMVHVLYWKPTNYSGSCKLMQKMPVPWVCGMMFFYYQN